LTLTFMGDNPLPAPSEIYANKIYVVRNGTSDDGKVIACLWNGTVFEWKDLAMTAEGTAGPPGPEGPKGDTGDQGPAGSKGEDGAQGIQGLEGSAGPKGDKGDKGDQGNVGLQGAQGLQGSPGVDGEDGAPGPQGSQGIQGLTGLPGDQGPQGQQGIQGVQGPQGDAGVSNYTINVQALTSSPTDAQTVYFGKLPKAPVTVAATSKIYIRKAGTIKIAEIYCYSGTPGTAEAWSLYIRKNNTTDYLIATLSVSASERVFSNAALSIAVAVGDYIEIKGIQPTWATNPLTTIYGGYIYIE
jgi:hypothetical protein